MVSFFFLMELSSSTINILENQLETFAKKISNALWQAFTTYKLSMPTTPHFKITFAQLLFPQSFILVEHYWKHFKVLRNKKWNSMKNSIIQQQQQKATYKEQSQLKW